MSEKHKSYKDLIRHGVASGKWRGATLGVALPVFVFIGAIIWRIQHHHW